MTAKKLIYSIQQCFGMDPLGIAVGFLVPPMLVENHDDISLIGDDLRLMFYIVAGVTTVLVVLVLFFFKAAPPTPPSAAQEATKTPNPLQSSPFLHSIKNLMLNRNYVLLLISYGMNVGVFYAISTLLNQVRWDMRVDFCPEHDMSI
uniref:Uncharacterized protein n=1 Tax=Anopheles culicifacies TaxID=139723 RepID=A0A182MFC6_9DIPT